MAAFGDRRRTQVSLSANWSLCYKTVVHDAHGWKSYGRVIDMRIPQRLLRWSLSFVVAAASLLTFATSGFSQDDEETKERQSFEDTVHVIQRKPLLEEGRFELTPRFGVSVNDSIYRSFKVGTNANYHITERLYVGGLFEWFDFGETLGGTTEAFERSFDQTSNFADAPVANWAGAVEAGYKPLYGKFALFNTSILYYDIGATLGAGIMNAGSIENEEESTFVGTASLVGRLFFNDWMAMNLELRDFLFEASLRGGNSLANLVTVSAGISLYLPTSARTEASAGGDQ